MVIKYFIERQVTKDENDKETIKEIEHKHLEYLSCGHQNNLRLEGRKSGVCLKCPPEAEQPETPTQ